MREALSDGRAAQAGRHLASLRERAGLKQVELARRVTWSAAVLSRVEAGKRPLSSDELAQLLQAIGTDDACRLEEILDREWRVLDRPPIGHCDRDLLWATELALNELGLLAQRPDVKSAFLRRLEEYREELLRTARLLLSTDHQVAFIGSIGVGKSTALCRLTGLEVPAGPRGPIPVLQSGGGGVTICEVHLRQGPDYGLIVDPRADAEIGREVLDFAEFLLGPTAADSNEPEGGDGEALGLSKEVVRAIRNMAGLPIRKEKGVDGRSVRTDEARQLAEGCADARTLAVEILARMRLHQRDRRDIWHSSTGGKEPLQWLKETFEQVNNGRHPQFSLPQRIEVVVPQAILEEESLSVRLIDTRGIDQTAARADIERQFDEPHTLAVLYSVFNEAPANAVQQLFKRALAAGVRSLPMRAAVLVLPRPGEALAVKDDLGFAAETVADGYELKSEQVDMRLKELGLPTMPIHFFNSWEDDPAALRRFILDRVNAIRESYRQRLNESIAGAKALVANSEKEQVLEVQREAARHLRVWLSGHRAAEHVSTSLQDSLLEALSQAHTSTIRASVRREGEWWKLEYSHQLGHGARRVASDSITPLFEQFRAIAENLIADPQLSEAHELVQQARRIMDAGIDDIQKKVQLIGSAVHSDGLRPDSSFWEGCTSEWGAGPGYRDRISQRNVAWFEAPGHGSYGQQVHELIEREWSHLLDRVASLLECC